MRFAKVGPPPQEKLALSPLHGSNIVAGLGPISPQKVGGRKMNIYPYFKVFNFFFQFSLPLSKVFLKNLCGFPLDFFSIKFSQ